MKKEIIPIVLATVCLVACSEALPQVNPIPVDGCRFQLGIDVRNGFTKVTDISQEDKINTMKVFVFRSDGSLDAQASRENGTSLTLSCTTLAKKVYVLVNASPAGEIRTEDGFNATVTDLADNSVGNFVMTGCADVSVPEDSSVVVDVRRIACRVVIKEMVKNFTSPAFQNASFKITDIYLKDAPGNTDYGVNAAPDKFYNTDKFDLDPGIAILGDSPELSLDNSNGTYRYYYCYPRTSSAPKRTRLVLKTLVNDEKVYYYPIDLPETMERNVSYEFSKITITRPGTDDPETPVSTGSVQFSLKIVPWTDITLPDETI